MLRVLICYLGPHAKFQNHRTFIAEFILYSILFFKVQFSQISVVIWQGLVKKQLNAKCI
jgi:hypothetical protein